MILPRAVDVYPAGGPGPGYEAVTWTNHGGIPTYTQVFRADPRFAEVLDLAAASGELRRIGLVGASNGAEAVSVLSYLDNSASVGRVSLTGIDMNSKLVEAANAARFEFRPLGRSAAERAEHVEEYRAYGLHVETVDDELSTAVIDARRLFRRRAAFWVADITRAGDAEVLPPSEVILCNNLLFHFRAETAEIVVRNMIGRLAPGGILSIGANTLGETTVQWNQKIGATLASEGAPPVLYSEEFGAPFAFQRQ